MAYLITQVSNSNTISRRLNLSWSPVPAFFLSSTYSNESAIAFYTVDDASFKGYNVTGKESIVIRKSVPQHSQSSPLSRNKSVADFYEFFVTLSLAPSATNFRNVQSYTTSITDIK